MKSFAYLLILFAALSMVCGCGARDVETDFSSCQIDFYKTTKQLTKEQEQDFKFSCMRSKGYSYIYNDVICKAMTPSGVFVESCFSKPSVIGELKQLFTK